MGPLPRPDLPEKTPPPTSQKVGLKLNNGAVCFLHKPFDDRSLMECLTTAIKLRSS